MDIVKIVLSLNLPHDQYVVIGSGAMAVHGIREAQDIDLFVTQDLYKKLHMAGWREEGITPHRHLVKDDIEVYDNWDFGDYRPKVEDLVEQADVIECVNFTSLDETIKWKLAYGRPKDFTDAELIKAYLESHT